MSRCIPFTAKGLEALRPLPERYDVREAGRTGLRLRVGPSGAKSFRWQSTSAGKVFTLGTFGDGTGGTITLADARAMLERYKSQVAAGLDPEATVDGQERPRTVEDLAALFIKESLKERRKRPAEAERIIKRNLLPSLGRMPLLALDAMACRRPIAAIVRQGHHRAAALSLALLKQMLRFGCANGLLRDNPARDLDPAAFGISRVERKRWLTAEEIPVVLEAISKSRTMDVFSKLGLRVLFFTGLRTAEALTLEWTDVDLEKATLAVRPENMKLTKAKAKNAGVYVVPLSTTALAAMRELRALAAEKDRWVFSSGRSGGNHLSEKALARAMHRLWFPERKNGAPVPDPPACQPATPHDFRRTLSTHLSETLRFPPHVGQIVLGHSLNALLGSDVATTYDRAGRLEERRQALEAYAVWVEGLLTGKTAEVVPFPAGGGVREAK